MALHGIILAAGLGSRQRALTNPKVNKLARHKAMLPVGNRVLIDFSIEALKKLNLAEIYVGTGPRPLSDTLEEHITNEDAYQTKIKVYVEPSRQDTAGLVKYLFSNSFITADRSDTICILPCDTPHNLDLKPVYEAHLKNNAGVTMLVYPLRWSAEEWKTRTFGTVQTKEMPEFQSFDDRNKFEEAVRNFTLERKEHLLEVKNFHEKSERDKCQSNLVNTSIYFFNAGFLMDLFPRITKPNEDNPLSDFGLHLFPALCNPSFRKHLSGDAKHLPFYAYILPEDVYWRDVGNPLALLKANMDVLDKKILTDLENSRFWHQEPWGWLGNFGSSVYKGSMVDPLPNTYGSIIGNHVVIKKGAKIERSVILDHVTVSGKIINSVIFPQKPGTGIEIEKGVELVNTLYVGGALGRELIQDQIIYPTPYGGTAFDPLSKSD